MKETDEILGKIKEEGAAYFAKDRGSKVEVGLYLEKLIEEHGMKKKDVVRKLIWKSPMRGSCLEDSEFLQGRSCCSVHFFCH